MVDELRVRRLLRWLTDRFTDLADEAGADLGFLEERSEAEGV